MPTVGARSSVKPGSACDSAGGGSNSASTELAVRAEKDDKLWKTLVTCSSDEARARVPFDFACEHKVLPISLFKDLSGKTLLCLISAYPLDAYAVQSLRFAAGCDIVIENGPACEIERAIQAAYCGGEQSLLHAVEEASSQCENSLKRAPASALQCEADNNPVPRLLEALIRRAIALDASDIHLEPRAQKHRVRFRVHGMLREDRRFEIDDRVAASLMRRVKVLSRMDTTCVYRPQEGGFSFETKQWSVRLRVSIFPQVDGEKLVIRLLDNQFLEGLDLGSGHRTIFSALGVTAEQERILTMYLGAAGGTILVCGPTGSGKSTLLYALIDYLHREWRNIVTIEDPVERLMPGINQTEVSRKHGLDYAELLPPLMRQDPDVLMIGEIRDARTAEMALTAGITGHLVLSTLHAGHCIEALLRLNQLGIACSLMATSLRLIIAQRLIPSNCPYCLRQERVSTGLSRLFNIDEDACIKWSAGCRRCDFSGVKKRLAVFELFPVTEAVRESLLSLSDGRKEGLDEWYRDIRERAWEVGYRPYSFSVREALLKGLVSPVQALRSLGILPEAAGYSDDFSTPAASGSN